MDPSTLQRMFEPFRQGDNSDTRKHGGVGLGLAISKSLVEQMGGRMYAESSPGKGSRFGFRLLAQSAPCVPVSLEEIRETWRGRTICVWDDDPVDLRTVESLLERCGIRLRYAETPEAVYSRLENEVPADAVICNVETPVMRERLAAFRLMQPAVPWIALSDWVVAPDEALQRCFFAWIDRPVVPEQLYAVLAQLVRRNE